MGKECTTGGEWGFERPPSLAELTKVLGRSDDVLLIGGGTDLIPAVKRKTVRPATLVSTLGVPELGGIRTEEDGSISVGAGVVLDTLARFPLIEKSFPSLAAAASTLSSRQIRNRGTVGGNLCLDTRCDYYNKSAFWRKEYPDCRKTGGDHCYMVPRSTGCHALHSGDLAPLLIALGATAEVASAREAARSIPLEEMYSDSGLRSTMLEKGEVLARVLLPSASQGDTKAAFLRWAPRESIDFPSVTVAAALGTGRSRLVVGHVLSRPLRVEAAEEAMLRLMSDAKTPVDGHTVEAADDEIAEAVVASLDMKSAHRGAVWYKKNVIRALVRQALAALRAGAGPTETSWGPKTGGRLETDQGG